jgi:hypothetical protein
MVLMELKAKFLKVIIFEKKMHHASLQEYSNIFSRLKKEHRSFVNRASSLCKHGI